MTSEGDIRSILGRALDADEAGRKDEAIDLYGQAVEKILRLEDREKREKLNKFAKQALDRAEELKGIRHQASGQAAPQASRHSPTVLQPVKSSSALGRNQV